MWIGHFRPLGSAAKTYETLQKRFLCVLCLPEGVPKGLTVYNENSLTVHVTAPLRYSYTSSCKYLHSR